MPFASAGNLRIHRLDDNNLFITSNMGLYTSKDSGRNWNRADVRDLRFQDVAGSGNALVVSLQQHGLIASFDSGKTWKHIDGAFAEGYVPAVHTQRNGSVVAASATEGLLSYEPEAKGSAIRQAVEEVFQVVEALKQALDQMEEVLELTELAERQKLADEREIESLRRALRQLQRPRGMRPRDDERPRENRPRQEEERPQEEETPAPAPDETQ